MNERIAQLQPCIHVIRGGRKCKWAEKDSCNAFWHTGQWVQALNEARDIAEKLHQTIESWKKEEIMWREDNEQLQQRVRELEKAQSFTDWKSQIIDYLKENNLEGEAWGKDILRFALEKAKERDSLKRQRDALGKAAQDFVDKVESGRARSKDSYGKFKAALRAVEQDHA